MRRLLLLAVIVAASRIAFAQAVLDVPSNKSRNGPLDGGTYWVITPQATSASPCDPVTTKYIHVNVEGNLEVCFGGENTTCLNSPIKRCNDLNACPKGSEYSVTAKKIWGRARHDAGNHNVTFTCFQ